MDPHSGSHEGSPHEAPRVHARTLSPQWSATEVAYLHPAVKGRSAVTSRSGEKPLWGKPSQWGGDKTQLSFEFLFIDTANVNGPIRDELAKIKAAV